MRKMDMRRCYLYLRTLEHRLQMVEDQQTHQVPESAEGLAQIACFMGYDGEKAFENGLTQVLETVQGHYARLFEREPELTDVHGNVAYNIIA